MIADTVGNVSLAFFQYLVAGEDDIRLAPEGLSVYIGSAGLCIGIAPTRDSLFANNHTRVFFVHNKDIHAVDSLLWRHTENGSALCRFPGSCEINILSFAYAFNAEGECLARLFCQPVVGSFQPIVIACDECR